MSAYTEVWSRSGCSLMLDDGREIWWPYNAEPEWIGEGTNTTLSPDEIAEYGSEYRHSRGIRK